MKAAKILKKEELLKLTVECPECEDHHNLNLIRNDVREGHFNAFCYGCNTDFEVNLNERLSTAAR